MKPAGPLVFAQLSGMRGGPGTDDPGRVTIPRATLSDLLARTYNVWIDQVSGPAWRFHIKLHHENRSWPRYELVVASGGPKLTPWIPPANTPSVAPGVDRKRFPTLPAGATKGKSLPRRRISAPIKLMHRESLAMFCQSLGRLINRAEGTPIGNAQARVIDMTGLTGTYEFTLEFTGPPRPVFVSVPAMPAASDPTESAPDLFTAIEKQLGLDLRIVRDIPVNIQIVDNADKAPTEN